MGGNAFKNINSRRIKREEIVPTLKHFVQKINHPLITYDYVKDHIMGSAGKQPDSGDLDIALDANLFSIDDLKSIGDKWRKFNPKYVNSTTIKSGQINLLSPIVVDNKLSDDLIQIDLILGPAQWLKFSHYSPGKDNSQYKGVFISTMLGVLAKFRPLYKLKAPSSSEFSNQTVAEVIWAYDLERGLKIIWKIKLDPSQKAREVDPDFWETNLQKIALKYGIKLNKIPRFPRIGYVDDPEAVLEILFQKPVSLSSVNSFEKLVDLVKKEFSPTEWQNIKKRTIEAIYRSSAKNQYKSIDDIAKMPIFN